MEKVVGAERRANALSAIARAHFAMQKPIQAAAIWVEALQETNRLTNAAEKSAMLMRVLSAGIEMSMADTVQVLMQNLSDAFDSASLQLMLANAYLKAGKKEKAQNLLETLSSAIPALDADVRQISLSGQLALLYFKLGDERKGANQLKEALALPKNFPDDPDAATELGRLAVEFFQAQRQADGKKVLQSAVASVSKLNDKASAMAVREALVELLLQVKEFTVAQSLAAAIPDVPERLKVLSQIAVQLGRQGQGAEAKQVAEQMYQLARSIRNTSNRAEAIGKVAVVLAQAGFPSEAQTKADEAIAAINAIPVDFDKSAVAAELAADFAEAKMFSKANLAMQRVKVPQHRAIATFEVGFAFTQAGEPAQALPLLLEALSLRANLANPEVKVKAMATVAVELHKAKSDKADSAFQASITALPEIKAHTKQLEMCRQIAVEWVKVGAVKQALQALRQVPDAMNAVVALSEVAQVCREKKINLTESEGVLLKALQESLP